MLFVRERVKNICADLLKASVKTVCTVENWERKTGFYPTPADADSSAAAWEDFQSGKDYWIGRDRHDWFRTTVAVPDDAEGLPLWFGLSATNSNWDSVVNPQFLIFINGELTQGADTNHREVKLAGSARAGETYTVDLQAYTGTDTDSSVGRINVLSLSGCLFTADEESMRLCYNLLVPNQIIEWLEKSVQSGSYEKTELERVLTDTVNLVDLRRPNSPEYQASVQAANVYIESELYEKLSVPNAPTVTCIGHTHIDVAWWWTVEQTKEKVARSFSTVLQLMDEYPDYKFMSSQPQLYQFVKDRYPGLYEKIREKIKEGRWEAEGGMWLEADCNLTSGESLVRQLLYGKKFFKEEFGVDSIILWLPDVFGYSAALPQIMKKSGIRYFMTTKIAWNQFDKFPYDTFWWKGIDGSEVFTYLITTQNADQPQDSFFTTYNGILDGISVMRTWERYQQKELNNDVLMAFGHGDGGGGPTRDMLEIAERMKKGLPGAPKVRIASARQYFDELYKRTADNPKLPKWVGELYLEYHRGTYTSMSRNKKANRQCEIRWQDAEFFLVWAERFGLPYPKDKIDQSWRMILRNQFHDILPGSSIKDVYDTTKVQYEQLLKDADEFIRSALQTIAGNMGAKEGNIAVFNSLSFARQDLAELPASVGCVKDCDGRLLQCQTAWNGNLLCLTPLIEQKGAGLLAAEKRTAEISDQFHNFENPFIIQDKSIETGDFIIEFDDAYQMSRIYDKKAKREVLENGHKGNVLIAYEDKPVYFDNWDIDIYYTEKSWIVDDLQSAEWMEKGPLRAVLSVKRRFCDSVIEQQICFYAHTRRIDFETYVDWKQHQVLLKVEFPVDINAAQATYEIQYGNITRPTHANTSWDMAKFEVCGHKWADLSEDGYGVSLLNDCKYGYSIQGTSMKLTLLKSGIVPNPVADQEEHRFTYSLYPHQGNWKEAHTVREAYRLNVPLYVCPIDHESRSAEPRPISRSLFSIDCENVMADTLKKAEDGNGLIVRLYEYMNRRTVLSFRWNGKPIAVKECDLMENDIGDIAAASSEFIVKIRPFEIKTYRIIET